MLDNGSFVISKRCNCLVEKQTRTKEIVLLPFLCIHFHFLTKIAANERMGEQFSDHSDIKATRNITTYAKLDANRNTYATLETNKNVYAPESEVVSSNQSQKQQPQTHQPQPAISESEPLKKSSAEIFIPAPSESLKFYKNRNGIMLCFCQQTRLGRVRKMLSKI
jgi:hypothetical protein